MSTLKKLAGETVIYGMGAILPRLMNYLLIASYLTFTMDRERFGIHAIMYSFVTVALVLFTLRMETTYFKFGSARGEMRDRAYNASMSLVIVCSSVLLGLMLVFRHSIASLLTRPEDSRFVVYFALILFLDAVAVIPYASLRMASRPIKFSAIKIINSVMTIVMILFCFEIMPRWIPQWYDTKWMLDYAFIPNVIASAFVLILLAKEIGQFRFRIDRDFWTKMLRYSWPLIIVGVAGGINQFSDRIFVSYLANTDGVMGQNLETAGLFTGAIKIASLMSLFITAFNYAVEPFFFKNASDQARETIYGPVALAYTISASALFLLISINIDTIQFMIGRDFREGVFIVPVALLSFLVLGLYYNVSIWYKLTGQTVYGAIIASLGTVLFVICNFVFIPKYGMIGANYSSLICFSFMCLLAYFWGMAKYPIPYPVVNILFYILLAVGLYQVYLRLPIDQFWLKTFVGNGLFIIFIALAYWKDFQKLKII